MGTHAIRTFEEIVAEIEIAPAELAAWIEQEWVLPARQGDTHVFNEADVARVRLICDLRRDMAVNDEAVPVVLQLLDQIYALRDTLAEFRTAIDAASPAAREEILGKLGPKAGD
jgi:chaperone modulatory protein CbpM